MFFERTLAKAIAEKFHEGQLYGEHKYMHHINEVVEQVELVFGTTDDRLIVIAYLHDIIEDTDATQELLDNLFSTDVVEAVVALTHNKGESRVDYLNRVKKNALARKVKMQDSMVNLKNSMLRFDMKRVKKYGEYLNILATD